MVLIIDMLKSRVSKKIKLKLVFSSSLPWRGGWGWGIWGGCGWSGGHGWSGGRGWLWERRRTDSVFVGIQDKFPDPLVEVPTPLL